jgi:hypothetical protein
MGAAIAILVLSPGIATAADAVTDTTVCQIASHPLDYAGKMVRVRGRILIAFEQFELSAAECKPVIPDMIWLEYGRGPKRQPTIWCCGDLASHDSIAVIQDGNFTKFDRYLTAKASRRNRYEVTATLTGRLDTAASADSSQRCAGGFGHVGIACSRVVIQSVADVVARYVRDPSK